MDKGKNPSEQLRRTRKVRSAESGTRDETGSEGAIRRRVRRRRWQRVVVGLAALVVFVTTYSLILPAITLERPLLCGQEEHTHDGACYTMMQVLTCGQVESSVHTHTETCYSDELILTCGKNEHTHSEVCYAAQSTAGVETREDWEEQFKDVALTGTAGERLVTIARTQLGYQENRENFIVTEIGDVHGYTRYGGWMGLPYASWNAAFVSYCLEYAGINEQTFPGHKDSSAAWAMELKGGQGRTGQSTQHNPQVPQEGTEAEIDIPDLDWATSTTEIYWRDAGDYTPKLGDLVFFNPTGNGVAQRVGIVAELRYADGSVKNAGDQPFEEEEVQEKDPAVTEAAAGEKAVLPRQAGTETPAAQKMSALLPLPAAQAEPERADTEKDDTAKKDTDEITAPAAPTAEDGTEAEPALVSIVVIEGDSQDQVRAVRYDVDDPEILGYGSLPEEIVELPEAGAASPAQGGTEELQEAGEQTEPQVILPEGVRPGGPAGTTEEEETWGGSLLDRMDAAAQDAARPTARMGLPLEEDETVLGAGKALLAGTANVSLKTFRVTLRSGATLTGEDYVWTPGEDKPDHPFIFRVVYATSGDYDMAAGEFQIRVPKSILRARGGALADYYEMSLPLEDDPELDESNLFVFREEEDSLVIYNRLEIPASQSGYFEVGYYTSLYTQFYSDYGSDESANGHPRGGSDPFWAEISLMGGEPVERGNIPVYIDTRAYISSTEKNCVSGLYNQWQSSWGPEPADAADYYYLIWTVRSVISYATQQYDFSLEDSFQLTEPEGSVVGYRLSGSGSSQFTDTNMVTGLTRPAPYGRYDYVLTRHKKSVFDPVVDRDGTYTVSNQETATVHPADRVDPDTSREAQGSWTYVRPSYSAPGGHFWSEKWGFDYSGGRVYDSDDIRDFRLGELESGRIPYIDDLPYYVYVDGYAYPWTLSEYARSHMDEVEADPGRFYGEEPVTWELTDNSFYLKALSDENFPEEALTAEDYQIDSLRLDFSAQDAWYNPELLRFSAMAAAFAPEEEVTVYGEFNGAFVKVAEYSPLNRRFTWTDSAYVTRSSGRTLYFTDNCSGFKLETTNRHYYTRMGAYPSVRLKPSETVAALAFHLDRREPPVNRHIVLQNRSSSSVYDGPDTSAPRILNFLRNANDYIVGVNREGHLYKESVGRYNDVVRRRYSVTWEVTASESFLNVDGVRIYIPQRSGVFYDLLPVGAAVDRNGVRAFADDRELSPGQFTVETIPNYKQSGRTLLVVRMHVEAKGYRFTYKSVHPWDSIKDFGGGILNPVAYETGNPEIGNGSRDDGGVWAHQTYPELHLPLIRDYQLMADLNPENEGVSPEDRPARFLYYEDTHIIQILTAASLGLNKKVMADSDIDYGYSTRVYNGGDYSYRVRYATDDHTLGKDMMLFDTLENYVTRAGKTSDWQGVLQSVDLSQLEILSQRLRSQGKEGVVPVVYYAEESVDLQLRDDAAGTPATIGGVTVDKDYDFEANGWTEAGAYSAAHNGDLSRVRSLAVDLRWADAAGTRPFTLPTDSSVTVTVYLRAPQGLESDLADPVAFNDVFLYSTVESLADYAPPPVSELIEQGFTQVHYRVKGDFTLKKSDSTDQEVLIPGVTFRLTGSSHYGTQVDRVMVTGDDGSLTFNDVERSGPGGYTLVEIDGVPDYQVDPTPRTVVVDHNGNVTVDGTPCSLLSPLEIPNEPRIHGDLEFIKRASRNDQSGETDPLQGVTFKLSGTSDYGNEITLYETSGMGGKVVFPDVELGTYTLTEFAAARGYILSQTEYTVTCDENGRLSIRYEEDGGSLVTLSQNENGDYVLMNEPLHELRLYKADEVSGNGLNGAVFTLTGTSDYGTSVEEEGTTLNGVLVFAGLEPGQYVLRETQAPDNDHLLSEDPWLVTIEKDGSASVSGCGKLRIDETDYIVIPNERIYRGKITITKRWLDEYGQPITDGRELPIPVVHLDTEEPELLFPRATISRTLWNAHVNKNGQFGTEAALNFASSFTQREDVDLAWCQENAIKIDDGTTKYSIYFWVDPEDSGKTYWWSDAAVRYFPADSRNLFYGSTVETLDLTGFDTSKVTNMQMMFSGCANLTELDVSNWNTSRVTNLSWMFSSCPNLKSLDLHARGNGVWDVSRCSNFEYMFALFGYDMVGMDSLNLRGWKLGTRCPEGTEVQANSMFYRQRKLTELDTSGWDTSRVTTTQNMFSEVENLKTVDMRDWDLPSVTNMNNMFYRMTKLETVLTGETSFGPAAMYYLFSGCSDLKELDLSGWNMENITSMAGMFSSCSSLTQVDLSSHDLHNVTSMSRMFINCSALRTADLSGCDVSGLTAANEMFYNCAALETADLSGWNTDSLTTTLMMFYGCASLKNLNLSGWNTSSVTNMNSMFNSCGKLEELDLSGWDTSAVTYMTSLFSRCVSLKTLDLSGWDTSAVTSMSDMFYYCQKLESLDVTGFDTSSVTNMSGMFNHCESLTELDISSFNTSSVTNMSSIFNGCSGLTELDVSTLDTSAATNMSSMFSGCSALTELDVSTLDTSAATNLSSMFAHCSSLSELDITAFDTSNVTSMYGLFQGCAGLAAVNVLGIDTSNVTDMRSMFYNCGMLTELDLSSFVTKDGLDTNSMFYQDRGLSTIYVGDGWDHSKLKLVYDTFLNIGSRLEGQQGTKYSNGSSVVYQNGASSKFAKVDGGPSDPGYFWYKAYTPVVGTAALQWGRGPVAVPLAETEVEADRSVSVAGVGSALVLPVDAPLTPPVEPDALPAQALLRAAELVRAAAPVLGVPAETADPAPEAEGAPEESAPAPEAAPERPEEESLSQVTLHARGAVRGYAGGSLDQAGTVAFGYLSKSVKYEGDPAQAGQVMEQWIDNGDGTWTYRFPIFDETQTLYLWESAMPGFDCDTEHDFYQTIRYTRRENWTGSKATITNMRNNDGDGSLTVKKTVDSDRDKDRRRQFRFRVLLELFGQFQVLKVDGDGAALPGAVLTLTEKEPRDPAAPFTQSVTSGPDGRAAFTGLPAGRSYTMTETSTPAGYVGSDLRWTVTVATDGGVSIAETGAGETGTDGETEEESAPLWSWDAYSDTFVLTNPAEGPVLHILKINELGIPLQGAEITLTSTEDFTDTRSVTTGEDGRATFTGLPVGTYVLDESTVPMGYDKISLDSLTVTVGEDGSVSLVDYFGRTSGTNWSWNEDTATFTLKNQQGSEVPSTGDEAQDRSLRFYGLYVDSGGATYITREPVATVTVPDRTLLSLSDGDLDEIYPGFVTGGSTVVRTSDSALVNLSGTYGRDDYLYWGSYTTQANLLESSVLQDGSMEIRNNVNIFLRYLETPSAGYTAAGEAPRAAFLSAAMEESIVTGDSILTEQGVLSGLTQRLMDWAEDAGEDLDLDRGNFVIFGDTIFYYDTTLEKYVAEFTLADGERLTLPGLPKQTRYWVRELGMTEEEFDFQVTPPDGAYDGEITEEDLHHSADYRNTHRPEVGHLEIKKLLQGEPQPDGTEVELTEEDLSKKFTFHITLSDSSVSGIHGDLVFTNGMATAYLAHNETAVIRDLPAGVSYTVTEDHHQGYKQAEGSPVGGTGTIVKDETRHALFTNLKEPQGEEPEGGFTLKKQVIGTPASEPFTFYVDLRELDPGGAYSYTRTDAAGTETRESFTASYIGAAGLILTLDHGDTLEFSGLPVGAKYTVAEAASAYYASYTVENAADAGSVARDAGSNNRTNQELSTSRETVEEDEAITVTFRNTSRSHEVIFAKTAPGGAYVEGATLQVIRLENGQEGDVVAQWVTGDDIHTLRLPEGSYLLRETEVPEGYFQAEDLGFAVDEEGNLTIDGQESQEDAVYLVSMVDEPGTVKIKKVDASGEPLPGVRLQILDEEGIALYTWRSGEEPEIFAGELAFNTRYTLHEYAAPRGYILAEDIDFALDSEGKLYTDPGLAITEADGVVTVTGTLAENNLISMVDHRQQNLEFLKADREGGPLLHADEDSTASFVLIPDAAGRTAETVGSAYEETPAIAAYRSVPVRGTDNARYTFLPASADPETADPADYGLAPGTYWLLETEAPKGYEAGTPRRVAVTYAQGTLSLSYPDGGGDAPSEAGALIDPDSGGVKTDEDTDTVGEDPAFAVVNKLIQRPILLQKVEAFQAGTGEEEIFGLAGAEFLLYRDGDMEEGEGVMTPKQNAEAIHLTYLPPEEAGGYEGFYLSDPVAPGDYWLVETRAPEGYAGLSGPEKVTVGEDTVQKMGYQVHRIGLSAPTPGGSLPSPLLSEAGGAAQTDEEPEPPWYLRVQNRPREIELVKAWANAEELHATVRVKLYAYELDVRYVEDVSDYQTNTQIPARDETWNTVPVGTILDVVATGEEQDGKIPGYLVIQKDGSWVDDQWVPGEGPDKDVTGALEGVSGYLHTAEGDFIELKYDADTAVSYRAKILLDKATRQRIGERMQNMVVLEDPDFVEYIVAKYARFYMAEDEEENYTPVYEARNGAGELVSPVSGVHPGIREGELQVTNTVNYTLPETGGEGAAALCLLGLVLAGAAAAGFLLRKRREG